MKHFTVEIVFFSRHFYSFCLLTVHYKGADPNKDLISHKGEKRKYYTMEQLSMQKSTPITLMHTNTVLNLSVFWRHNEEKIVSLHVKPK